MEPAIFDDFTDHIFCLALGILNLALYMLNHAFCLSSVSPINLPTLLLALPITSSIAPFARSSFMGSLMNFLTFSGLCLLAALIKLSSQSHHGLSSSDHLDVYDADR